MEEAIVGVIVVAAVGVACFEVLARCYRDGR